MWIRGGWDVEGGCVHEKPKLRAFEENFWVGLRTGNTEEGENGAASFSLFSISKFGGGFSTFLLIFFLFLLGFFIQRQSYMQLISSLTWCMVQGQCSVDHLTKDFEWHGYIPVQIHGASECSFFPLCFSLPIDMDRSSSWFELRLDHSMASLYFRRSTCMIDSNSLDSKQQARFRVGQGKTLFILLELKGIGSITSTR